MDLGGNEAETVEKHYRVVLDFRVLVREITPEVCQESFFFNDRCESAGEPYFQENIERQRRLYELLRGNREALEQYLLRVLTEEAGNFVYEGLPEAFDTQDEEKLLTQLYRGMDEEDVRFFDNCRDTGALDENTELVGKAFKVEWAGAEVEEMSRRVAGDVKRAEVAGRAKSRLIRKLNSSRGGVG
jgi:hypothetical protein